jgi:hypothetical protein
MVDRADDVEFSSTLALVDSGRLHRTFRLRHVSQPRWSAHLESMIPTYSEKPWAQNGLGYLWA